MKNISKEQMLKMKLHETIKIHEPEDHMPSLRIQRVFNGWLYTKCILLDDKNAMQYTTTFVPENI